MYIYSAKLITTRSFAKGARMRNTIILITVGALFASCGVNNQAGVRNFDDAYFVTEDLSTSEVYGATKPATPLAQDDNYAPYRTKSYGQSYSDRFSNFNGGFYNTSPVMLTRPFITPMGGSAFITFGNPYSCMGYGMMNPWMMGCNQFYSPWSPMGYYNPWNNMYGMGFYNDPYWMYWNQMYNPSGFWSPWNPWSSSNGWSSWGNSAGNTWNNNSSSGFNGRRGTHNTSLPSGSTIGNNPRQSGGYYQPSSGSSGSRGSSWSGSPSNSGSVGSPSRNSSWGGSSGTPSGGSSGGSGSRSGSSGKRR